MNSETIKCTCGESFQWEPFDWLKTEAELEKFRPDSCPTCSDRQEAEHQAEQLRIKQEQQASDARENALRQLPALFHATDTAHPRFNAQAWKKLKDHRLSAEKPWLGLLGETGRCKSRMAAMFFTEEAERIGRRWEGSNWRRREPSLVFVTGHRICELAGIVQTGSFDQKENARKELDEIQDCNLLLIDDLGKGRITEAVAAVIHSIVDHRYANLMKTIWTANSAPEQIATAMNPDMAEPFERRLHEHSKIFTFKSQP
jgi:DNA replication protein DnaC